MNAGAISKLALIAVINGWIQKLRGTNIQIVFCLQLKCSYLGVYGIKLQVIYMSN